MASIFSMRQPNINVLHTVNGMCNSECYNRHHKKFGEEIV